MRSPRILIQWRPRLLGRIVALELFQRRFLVQPFVIEYVIGFRFGRRDARRLRLVCACVHFAFFRWRLKKATLAPRRTML